MKQPVKLEAMVFDVGGVLIEANDVVAETLQWKLGMTQQQVDDMWARLIPQLGSGTMTENEFWVQASADYSIRQVSPEEDILGEAFAANLAKNRELFGYIDQLKASRIRLAVLSDTIEPHARALRAAGIFQPFDDVYLSYEIGIRKQNPGAFLYMLDKLQLRPEQVGFTDDSAANVLTATELNINAVVFENLAQFKKDAAGWLPKTPSAGV